jgi:hypothetical protein
MARIKKELHVSTGRAPAVMTHKTCFMINITTRRYTYIGFFQDVIAADTTWKETLHTSSISSSVSSGRTVANREVLNSVDRCPTALLLSSIKLFKNSGELVGGFFLFNAVRRSG